MGKSKRFDKDDFDFKTESKLKSFKRKIKEQRRKRKSKKDLQI